MVGNKMIKFKEFINENNNCPTATIDIHINLRNRQEAIDEYMYGPANPEKPGDYWKKLGDTWGIDEKTASTMRCGNCAAFDVSDKILKCIEKGIKGKESEVDAMATIHKANLGYCNLFHFKCAADRSCGAWLTGGAIENSDRTD
jgi:hypothetical protein